MPRRAPAGRRETEPDSKYQNRLLQKFMNSLMYDGKKSTARGIVYDAFDLMEKRTGEKPLDLFQKAVNNAKPMLEVKSRRVGGVTYQVPVEVRPERRTSLAIRWLIQYARERGGHSMIEKLAAELQDASRGQGGAIKKREDLHRMAEANRAFSHYRW